MPLEDVTSVAMTREEDWPYFKRRRWSTSPTAKFWKRKQSPRKQPVSVRTESNYWDNRLNYFIYVILIGNTVDGLPLVFRFSLELSGVTLMLLLLAYTFFLVMPIMYMEIFLGRYTRLTYGQMYRMAPIFFGFSVLIFFLNIIYAPIRSTEISLFLIAAMKSLADRFYGEECPPNAKGCFLDWKFITNKTMKTWEYEYMAIKYEGKEYRYVNEYLYWSSFKNIDDNNYPITGCILANLATWFFITMFCMLGMKVMGLVLRGTFVIHTIMYTMIFLMAMTSKGVFTGLEKLTEFKLRQPRFRTVIKFGFFIAWRMGLNVPFGYMTSTACSKFKRNLDPGYECLYLSLSNNALTLYYLVIVYAVGGVLVEQMHIPIHCTIVPFAGLYYAMIPQFMVIRECPNVIIALFHLTNWLLEIVRLALSLHLLILNIYDFLPKFAYYHSYVKIMVTFVSTLLSVIASFKIFTMIIIPAYNILCCYFLEGFCLLLVSVMVFYCYGVNRLNDDIHFMSGRRPIQYWRILWYIYPAIVLLGLLFIGVGELERTDVLGLRMDLPKNHPIVKQLAIIGLGVCAFYSFVVLFSTFFYIVMGLKSSTTIMNLFKPQFHWGPPNKEARVARKSFAPRSSIRSQPQKKKKQRFRVKSIKQIRERDLAEHTKAGKIFLDALFFANIGNTPFRTKGYRFK